MPMYQMKIDLQKEKTDEFLRTLRSLWFSFLKEDGCLGYHVQTDLEKENRYCMIGEYDTHEAMARHFQSRHFEVLVGAVSTLGKDAKLLIAEVLETGGLDLAKSKCVCH